MAIFYYGNPLTGTPEDDFLIDYPNNPPNNTLSALGGDDVILADFDYFFGTAEGKFGTSIGTAYNITAVLGPWSTSANNEIANSTTIPHTSIVYQAAATEQAYWRVIAVAGQTIALDIDFSNTNTVIQLIGPDGVTVLASNDNSGSVDIGSNTSFDPSLTFTIPAAGTYYIRVYEAGSSPDFEVGDSFVLNVSLSGQAVTNDTPVSGNDTLIGGSGVDYLSGGGGHDLLSVGNGHTTANEIYNGGAGVDTLAGTTYGGYDLDFSSSFVHSIEALQFYDVGAGQIAFMRFLASQFGGNGIASDAAIRFSGFDDVTDRLVVEMGLSTTVNLSNLLFSGVDSNFDAVFIEGDASAENIIGSDIRDNVFAGDGNDTIDGGTGNDSILGGGGDDRIVGGAGADTMAGGFASDTYFVDSAGDIVDESFSEGFDTVYASVSYTLMASSAVEVLATPSVAGTAAINLTGNNATQQIHGNNGTNTLNGGGGADTMRGYAGNDTYIVDNAGDVIIEVAGGGSDRLYTSVSYVLAAAAAVEFMATPSVAGTAAINLTGNSYAQQLHGNAAANTLNGGAGADTMTGYGGNDAYIVDNVSDVIVEAAGNGSDRAYSSVNYTLAAGASVELLATSSVAGTTAINLAGNDLAQQIVGNNGNNVLNGYAGADTISGNSGNDSIFGGAGIDVLSGGAGNDYFLFNSAITAANADTITDYNVAADTFWLDNAVFTALALGDLAAGAFAANTTGAATQADDRIIYETDTGILRYDPDGVGGAAGVVFATVSAGLALTAADFDIV